MTTVTLSPVLAQDVAAIRELDSIDTILRLLARVTGLRIALVARVTEESWTCCAVHDDAEFGLEPGDSLDVATTYWNKVAGGAVAPLVIEQASRHPDYCGHPGLELYGIESYIAVPLSRPDGRIFGTLCALDPDPARGLETQLEVFQLLAQLISFQLEAEERGEERETFLSVLGHDLRNPLHAIHFSAHVLLARDGLPAELKSPVDRILRSVDRIESMVADLLDFARGRFGGGLSLDRHDVEVGGLVRHVVDELAAIHPERAIEVELEGSPRARWDPDRVAQALSNLVSNALAYSPPETPVTVRVVEAAAERLELAVHNRGEPIPPDVQARIFQPFSRGGGDTTSGSGLGLGLYIAAQIAHAHDGTIALHSDAQEGTTFRLLLPSGNRT